MDSKVKKYRKKHPKCKFCKYLKHVIPHVSIVPSYYLCEAKDKIIKDFLPDMTEFPRLCSCYELKDEK